MATRTQFHWRDWLIAIVGLWLVSSPYVFGYGLRNPAIVNSCVLGLILITFNLMSACRLVEQGNEFFNLVLGAWLLVSPYALRFVGEFEPTASTVAAGVMVIALALWELSQNLKTGP